MTLQKSNFKNQTSIALFSGGLDSILACRVVMEQGIRVKALRFVTPFFGYELLDRRASYIEETRAKYGIDVELVDIGERYLQLLRAPAHGFGKHFNPCVDCKILLLSLAREMLPRYQASFLITGEVLGQRPMSQRRDTLRVIERDSGCEEILVRPLCARRLAPTPPELAGLIDRDRLLDFSGRGRSAQIALARRFGISDYPSPAGGCFLTDPILSRRIKKHYEIRDTVLISDILFLMAGRQFELPSGARVALGRDQADNRKVMARRRPGDWILERAGERPGPTALLRHARHPADLEQAASLVARYTKKKDDASPTIKVKATREDETILFDALPPAEEDLKEWMR